ncbi:MAG TPA: VWA domain-containing protein [Pyrinomonadaceae bacterium]|jgi:VWFA-related protein
MKRRTSLSLILILSLFASAFGQTPSTPAPQQGSDEDVVRITTNLVQVDAVVTDKSGRQVTDLKPEEFEITEDGRAQTITNFSYVTISPTTTPGAAQPTAAKVAGVQPARVRAQDVRRTIVIVIDDLGMSFESMSQTRSALKKFVDETQPGDLVSIVRTSGGIGALQQFTTDKARLQASVSRLRWNPNGRGGVESVNLNDRKEISSSGTNTVAETIKSLNFIVNGLKTMPGRKSLLLFSDSFTVFESTRNSDLAKSETSIDKPSVESLKQVSLTEDPMLKAVEKQIDRIQDTNVFLNDQKQLANPVALLAALIDNANRSSVVIYTIDPRGLAAFSPSAETSSKGIVVKDLEPTQYGGQLQTRSQTFWETQVGLGYVAKQTGGFLISNTNDIGKGLQRIMGDLKGYYLIGYRPSEDTFSKTGARPSFRSIKINVKRSGLTVRSRNGFYGVTEEERRTQPKARSEILLAALNTPFQSGDINLRLTSLFSNDPRSGSFMRSMLYVDVSGFSFKPDAEGWQTASMEVLAMTFSEAGEEIEKMARAETLQAKGATFQRLLRSGLVYSFDIPIKKPGSYQLRIAVRDPATDRIGTATQLIEVPDLSKGRLALSGIYARGADAATPANTDAANAASTGLLSAPPKIGGADNAMDETGTQPSAAARRLRRGMALDYSYVIFNARRSPSNNLPQLKIQLRVFRDGQQVWTGDAPQPDAGKQTDATRLVATGRLEITPEMQPGEYILQVVVTDTLAGNQYSTAAQWIDFEVVK